MRHSTGNQCGCLSTDKDDDEKRGAISCKAVFSLDRVLALMNNVSAQKINVFIHVIKHE